jgi:hypothetical protein
VKIQIIRGRVGAGFGIGVEVKVGVGVGVGVVEEVLAEYD